LVFSEAKYLWPNSPNPDIFILFGTGSESTDLSSNTVLQFRNILVDSWIPRIYCSFFSLFERQCIWREVLGLLDNRLRDDYFRFDIAVSGGLLRIDNTEYIDILSKLVRSNPDGQRKYQKTIVLLFAISFYFQLEIKSEYYLDLFQYIDSIHCRVSAEKIIEWIDIFDNSRKDFYKNTINLDFYLTSNNICRYCYKYYRPICFIVYNLKENIGFFIYFGGKFYRLNIFSNNIYWFIEQQEFE